jgi:hypothetical protein
LARVGPARAARHPLAAAAAAALAPAVLNYLRTRQLAYPLDGTDFK